MRIWQKLASVIVVTLGLISNASAENFKLKYSSNYLMPAYINFNNGGGQYNIQAKLMCLYIILSFCEGTEKTNNFIC